MSLSTREATPPPPPPHPRPRGRHAPSARACAVARSNKRIYAQVIDDARGHTLAAAGSHEAALRALWPRATAAAEVGKLLAERAKQAGVEQVVFDRGGYKYHGRVKSLADGAREGGLEF